MSSSASRIEVSEKHPLGVDIYYATDGAFCCNDPDTDDVSSGITTIIYTYEAGSYEGSGIAIYEANGLWYEHNMGHCSCYGSWDSGIEPDGKGVTLSEIRDRLSVQDGYNGEYYQAILSILEEREVKQ